MGLLTEIALLPLAPVRLTGWILARAMDEALRVERDEIRRRLVELEELLRSGQLSEAEFDRLEDELLDRLEELDGPPGTTRPQNPGRRP